MKAQGELLRFIDNDPNLTYERALELLKLMPYLYKKDERPVQQSEQNEALTQMGRYYNAATVTPTESGMTPGRCPV